MANATAVQLVNHLRRQLRLGDDITTIASPEDKALLDIVNQASQEILEEFRWEFDERNDGVLNTVAKVEETTTATWFNNSTAFATSASLTLGSYIIRVVPSSDPDFSDTAFRLLNFSNAGNTGTLDAAFLGPTDINTTATRFVAEYILPPTVKKVTSVRFQEQDLELVTLDPNEGFRRAIPRLQDEISDNPRMAVVGGQMESTYDSDAASSGTVGTVLLIYPVPESAYRLEYSYVLRQPELVNDTDSISNVPAYIIHEIRRRGLSLAFSTVVANDPDLAALNDTMSERRIRRLHGLHRSASAARRRLASLDELGAPTVSLPKDPYFHGEP